MTTTNPLLPLAALASALVDYYNAEEPGDILAAQILVTATWNSMSPPQTPDDMDVTLTLKGEDIKAIYDALDIAAEDIRGGHMH